MHFEVGIETIDAESRQIPRVRVGNDDAAASASASTASSDVDGQIDRRVFLNDAVVNVGVEDRVVVVDVRDEDADFRFVRGAAEIFASGNQKAEDAAGGRTQFAVEAEGSLILKRICEACCLDCFMKRVTRHANSMFLCVFVSMFLPTIYFSTHLPTSLSIFIPT